MHSDWLKYKKFLDSAPYTFQANFRVHQPPASWEILKPKHGTRRQWKGQTSFHSVIDLAVWRKLRRDQWKVQCKNSSQPAVEISNKSWMRSKNLAFWKYKTKIKTILFPQTDNYWPGRAVIQSWEEKRTNWSRGLLTLDLNHNQWRQSVDHD